MDGARALRKLDTAYGFWSATGNTAVIDTAASIGPDFICVDTQHGASLSSLDPTLFTTMAHFGVTSLVRVDSINPTSIGRALDLGADGVVVPMVQSREDATLAVSACRVAPEGSRSYGVQSRRLARIADTPPICWIQIETRHAIDNLREIASVEGVDALYIGPADLGLALVGEPVPDVESVFDGSHIHSGEMAGAFTAVSQACSDANIHAGLHCGSGKAASIAARHGFTVAAVAADLGLIGAGLADQLSAARG